MVELPPPILITAGALIVGAVSAEVALVISAQKKRRQDDAHSPRQTPNPEAGARISGTLDRDRRNRRV